MAYQFGTKRLSKNPLDELLELQQNTRATQQNKALQGLNRFKFTPIFEGTGEDKGKFFQTYSNKVTGSMETMKIAKTEYERLLLNNQVHNAYRDELGQPAIEPYVEPKPEPKEPGILSKGLDWLKGKLSSDEKPPSLQTKNVGDPGKNVLQPANSNVAGLDNDKLSKPPKGGEIKTDISDVAIGNINNVGQKPAKIETTPSGIPMDVTNQSQTVDLKTNQAYNKSLESLKGKFPPNPLRSKEAPKEMTQADYDKVRDVRDERILSKAKSQRGKEAWRKEVDPNSPLGKYWSEKASSRLSPSTRDVGKDMDVQRKLLNYAMMKDAVNQPPNYNEMMMSDVAMDDMTLTPEQYQMMTGQAPAGQMAILPMNRKAGALKTEDGKAVPAPTKVQYAGKGKSKKKDYGTRRLKGYSTPAFDKAIKSIGDAFKSGDKKLEEWALNRLKNK